MLTVAGREDDVQVIWSSGPETAATVVALSSISRAGFAADVVNPPAAVPWVTSRGGTARSA